VRVNNGMRGFPSSRARQKEREREKESYEKIKLGRNNRKFWNPGWRVDSSRVSALSHSVLMSNMKIQLGVIAANEKQITAVSADQT